MQLLKCRSSLMLAFHELVSAIDWHSEARGLITSYEKSNFELPRVIRGSNELTILTLVQLQAKASRILDKLVAVKNAQVHQNMRPQGEYINFTLLDDTGVYINCFVKQDTALEDFILTQSKGHFYGIIRNKPRSGAFIVTEWEPAD